MLNVRLGVRTRVLAIALIPSLVLLGIGVGAAGYLVREGRQAEQWAETNRVAVGYARDVVTGVQHERMLSLQHLSGVQSDPAALATARNNLDTAFAELAPFQKQMESASQGTMGANTGGFDTLRTRLPQIRGQIDAGRMSIADTYGIYNRILDAVALGANLVTSNAPDARVGVALLNGVRLLHVMEGMSRSAALAAAEMQGSIESGPMRDEYRNQVGFYRTALPQLAADLGADPVTEEISEEIKATLSSPAWQQVAEMEHYLINSPDPDEDGDVEPPPMSFAEWSIAQEKLSAGVTDAWIGLNNQANQYAASEGQSTTTNALWVGGAVLALALAAFLLSLWLANRLIGRLGRLRKETLRLADVELPETMRKLDAGEDIDPESSRLDFGHDEIGSVAQAFNRAHAAAVSAAATESRTREGVRAVFLNIAHRSQMIVHRQLEVLDEAERRQEDPALLDTFFRLDHLATRERRNAENLIILGGGVPGRQWRRPVPLFEMVRSAIGESLDYTRVQTRRMPKSYILGNVVADFIHLLAELVDNATAFSPPQSRVEVSGNEVGKGIVIEITDQGMGMSTEEIEHANEMLRNPPDFGVGTLSATSHLGLFVVSQLSARHGISVQLTDSEYGGIRAIVLVPKSVVAADAPPTEYPSDRFSERRPEAQARGLQSLGSIRSASFPVGVEELAPPIPAPPTEQPVPAVATPQALTNPELADSPPRDGSGGYSAPTLWDEPKARTGWTESATPETVPDNVGGGRPSLPRRRRQASLAPELAHDTQFEAQTEQPAQSAEQARDLMSSIAFGTQQGRRPEPEPGSTNKDEKEGEGDYI